MFRKRIKKSFPDGTFIPTPARICAIIQLCLAFSVLLWNASEPFIGEIFNIKSSQLLYQEVMGASDHKNIERFKALPEQTQEWVVQGYQSLQKQLQRSFWDKLKSVIYLFFYEIPSWELAWILLSIIISILLLKRVEGASQAVWLLPILVACYAADIRLHTKSIQDSEELKLFPSENELVENYLETPLSDDVFEQQKQLINGWKQYLVVKWAGQIPSKNEKIFDQQAEEGRFHFTLARLELRSKEVKTHFHPALWQLILYFFWNAYFAYTAWKYTSKNLVCSDLP